ncbi:hypothetical protein [Campylobacter helveticus]|uniref:hypothetical protein n=1 Tax=Campylobacter helveticus TaxID=28898 RepID=UPI002149EBA9|nr:hypothetical protein [Campylobacter helveticus]MCR2062917.1 hypothetical protein [Campylobacter helveticus]
MLYKKGFSFNPANYVKISYALVVIDGTNKKEIEWFKTSGYANKPLINFYSLMEAFMS